MSLTPEEARDAAIAVVDVPWKASPVSGDVPMLYDDVKGDPPGEDAATTRPGAFARTTIRIASSPQITQGNRRWQTTGFISVQIFTPKGDGRTLGDRLSLVVLNALRSHRGSAGTLFFYDAVPNEIETKGAHSQINVQASFRFQEVVTP